MNLREAMLEEVYIMRGKILQFSIEIEVAFDMYISRHFTQEPNKQTELLALLLAPRTTFDSKYQIFHYLVDKYNPEFRKALPKFPNDFKEVIEWRNMFAHYPVDFSEEAMLLFKKERKVSLIKLKNSSKFGLASTGTLNMATVDHHIEMIKKIAGEMHKLLGM